MKVDSCVNRRRWLVLSSKRSRIRLWCNTQQTWTTLLLWAFMHNFSAICRKLIRGRWSIRERSRHWGGQRLIGFGASWETNCSRGLIMMFRGDVLSLWLKFWSIRSSSASTPTNPPTITSSKTSSFNPSSPASNTDKKNRTPTNHKKGQLPSFSAFSSATSCNASPT